jgi:hypothetical protein
VSNPSAKTNVAIMMILSINRIRHIAILSMTIILCDRIIQFQRLFNRRTTLSSSTTTLDSLLWMELSNNVYNENYKQHKLYRSTNDVYNIRTTNSTRQQQPQQLEILSEPAFTLKELNHKNAIIDYISKVKTTNVHAKQCTMQRKRMKPTVNLSIAYDCLQFTTPTMQHELIYPDDADEHYNTIRIALSEWVQHSDHTIHIAKRYRGPWIENQFIHHFESLYDDESLRVTTNSEVPVKCLSHYFGPFIPIFIPWVDHLVQNHHQYPIGLIETLRSVLRPNVPYITVSQNDEGLVGKNEFNMLSIPNLLVLSAGGYGHVPIPLIKQEEPLIHDTIPIPKRKIDISYVGSLKNAPYAMRRKMHETFKQHYNTKPTLNYQYYYGMEWRTVVSHSKLSLVPRGYGRSAYHLMEVLQMGYIPIYIYLNNDSSWIPYSELYDKIGYKSDIAGLKNLIVQLRNISIKEIQQREEKIESLRNSHFTFDGVLYQIGKFMIGQTNDLRCQPLPSSVTGK